MCAFRLLLTAVVEPTATGPTREQSEGWLVWEPEERRRRPNPLVGFLVIVAFLALSWGGGVWLAFLVIG